MKSTKEPREKKPRVWKAWAVVIDGNINEVFGYTGYNKRTGKAFVIPVTITERKPNVQRAK